MAPMTRAAARERRHRRLRQRLVGTTDRPRLAVFRSLKHTQAQVIDDSRGQTLAAASTLEPDIPDGHKANRSLEVGRRIAARARQLDIKHVVFDRGGFKFHGRVKAVADGAREGGLDF